MIGGKKKAPPRSEMGKLQVRPGDVELTFAQVSRIPVFAGLGNSAARKLRGVGGRGAIVLRLYRAGDVICRQGEPGWTAFYIMRDRDLGYLQLAEHVETLGELEPLRDNTKVTDFAMMTSDPKSTELRTKAHVTIAPAKRATPARFTGFANRMASAVRGVSSISIDAPVTLRPSQSPAGDGELVSELHEGDLFGEMSCFTHMPRSATVRATEDCFMLELVRNVLEAALENPSFKQTLQEVYKKRVLATHVRAVPIFASLPSEAIAVLVSRAELKTLRPAETLFDEGDDADAIYIVRFGTLKVHNKGAGDRVLTYLSRGDAIGFEEMANQGKWPHSCTVFARLADESPRAVRPSTSPAGRAEIVKISRALFDQVAAQFTELGEAASLLADSRSSQPARVALPVQNLAGALGLLHADKLMLVDLDRCTRCDDCVQACIDVHPDGISRLQRTGPRFANFLIPNTCRQCHDPTCLIGCPVGSIHRGASSEIVVEDWCIGCGLCAEQCPYDAIAVETRSNDAGDANRQAVVCDQCASTGGTPMCVYACGRDAATRVDGETFFAGWKVS